MTTATMRWRVEKAKSLTAKAMDRTRSRAARAVLTAAALRVMRGIGDE